MQHPKYDGFKKEGSHTYSIKYPEASQTAYVAVIEYQGQEWWLSIGRVVKIDAVERIGRCAKYKIYLQLVNAGTKLRRERKVQKECIEVRVASWLCRESCELAMDRQSTRGVAVRVKMGERRERQRQHVS